MRRFGETRQPDSASAQELAQLRKELAQARAQIAELESKLAESASKPSDRANAIIAALTEKLAQTGKRLAEERALVHSLRIERLGLRFAPKPRAPKAEKRELPPDEHRDRIIKSQATRIRNLTQELNAVRTWRGHDGGSMDFATMSAIAKCLHPDAKPSEEQRAAAMRLFTDWKSDKDKTRRKARQKSR